MGFGLIVFFVYSYITYKFCASVVRIFFGVLFFV
jgi:hypothetical protein